MLYLEPFTPEPKSPSGRHGYCRACCRELAKELRNRRRAGVVLPTKPGMAASRETGRSEIRGRAKRCLRRGEMKPLMAFSPQPSSLIGRGAYCHPCAAAYAHERRDKEKAEAEGLPS